MFHRPFGFLLPTVLGIGLWITVLGKSPAGQGGPAKLSACDRYGDPLPAGAIARLGTTRLRHQGEVTALAFSPDSKMLASGGKDNLVRLWETATGKEIRQFQGHRDSIISLAFSPDGKLLASTGGSDGTVRLWQVENGKEIRQWRPSREGAWFYLVAFARNGFMLAATESTGAIRIWNIATGRDVGKNFGHPGVMSLAFVPDSKSIVTSGNWDKAVYHWEISSGKLLRRFKANGTTAALSRDGKTIAYQDGRIKLVDLATGKEIGQLAGHSDMVITGLAFSPDCNSLISAGEDMTIRVWNMLTAKTIRVWNTVTAKEIYRIAGVGKLGLALSPDGKILAAIAGCTIRMWEVNTGTEVLAFDGHRDKVQTIALSPDGKTLASVGISNKTVHLWDTASSKEIRRCTGHEDWVISLTFSPNGKILASGGGTRDPTICLWEVTTGKILRQLPANSGGFAPVSMAFSPDGKLLASAGRGFAINLWEVETGKKIRQISFNLDVIAFSPAGKFLASAGPVRLWHAATGNEERQMENSPPRVSTLAFSPDGKTLAGGIRSENDSGFKHVQTIRLWEVASGKERRQFVGDQKETTSLAFSPDGWTLVSGSDDATVRLWEVASGRIRRRFHGHQGKTSMVAFSQNGKTVVSASADTTILIWDTRYPESQAGRDLTPKQLEDIWATLIDYDAEKAYHGITALVSSPRQAVPFIQKRLQPVSQLTLDKIPQLIADLSSDHFGVRNKAMQELGKVTGAAEAALQKARRANPPLEVSRRLNLLLARLDQGILAPELLRGLRAIEILELIGSREALRVIQELARGAPTAHLTQEAQDAWQRLTKRPANH